MRRDENDLYHMPQAIESPLQRTAELAAQGTGPLMDKLLLWRNENRTGAGRGGRMTPAKHWCIECDHPATECECADTDGWRYDPLTEVWMPPLSEIRGLEMEVCYE